jgi:hypothetical protein
MSMAYYAPSSEPPSDRIGRLRHLFKTLYSRVTTEPGHWEYGGQNGPPYPRALWSKAKDIVDIDL